MPSSISSSSRPIPGGAWSSSGLMGLSLTLLFFVAWEMVCRNNGYGPNLNETSSLWASARWELKCSEPGRAVIVGASRAEFDSDLQTYADYFKTDPPVQLALPGAKVLMFLEDLAEDESFAGPVICGVVPGLFFAPQGFPVDRSTEAVQYAKDWSPSQRIGHMLGVKLQQVFAFIQQEDLTLNALLERLPIANRPKLQLPMPALPPYMYTLEPNRQARLYAGVSMGSALAKKIQQIWLPLFTPPPPPPHVTPDQFKEMFMASVKDTLARTKSCVDRIKARGGKVVFVRFPSAGGLRELERKFSPRHVFWEGILAATGAPGIHFEDHPSLSGYDCPEWSHLSPEDSVKFTRALMPLLKKALEK